MKAVSLLTLPSNLPVLQCPLFYLLHSLVSLHQYDDGNLIREKKKIVWLYICFKKDFFSIT